MATYGEIIDNYDPSRDVVYNCFIDYFRNPIMTKIKDTQVHSMYLTKLYCLLNRECRYIIVFVNKDTLLAGVTERLSNLKWASFQTRSLMEQYNSIEPHGYEPNAEGPLMARINRVDISPNASTYLCEDFPLKITLLHTEKNTSQSYQNSGTVIHALETFQTIITFTIDEIFEHRESPNSVNNINMTPINDRDRTYVPPPRKITETIPYSTVKPTSLNPSIEQIKRTVEILPRENISSNINYYDENNRNYHTNSIRTELISKSNRPNEVLNEPKIINNNIPTAPIPVNPMNRTHNRPATPFPSSQVPSFPHKNATTIPYSTVENTNNINQQNRPQIKPPRAIGNL